MGITQSRFKSLRLCFWVGHLKDQMSGEKFQTLNDLKSLVECLIIVITPEQCEDTIQHFLLRMRSICSERWWPYRTASIKLSRWKTVACFCIKFCYLLSEWFLCISVKACCITFQGHLVIKDCVEVIEFGTPCIY